MRTVLSSNRLQNLFSRFSDNEKKKGVLFENDSQEIETKLRVKVIRFPNQWKFSYGLNFQNSTYKNNTFSLLNDFNYDTNFSFFKYGFYANGSRSFINNRLSFSFGFRFDADTFSKGSSLIENFSPRLATSYNISQDGKWKLNSSIGRYYKIPTYTMLGFRDNKGI